MKDIPTYNTFKIITPINEGMSGDRKSFIEANDGKRYLLRVSDIKEIERKKKEFETVAKLHSAGIPMPSAVDFGICCSGKSVYTLLDWIDGNALEKSLVHADNKTCYRLGLQAGEILRKIHNADDNNTDTAEWGNRYFSVIDERLEAFRNDGVKFDGYDKILNFINGNRDIVYSRPQCHLHGDYHAGNIILSPDEKLYVIDWHTVDFDNYGDPWYDFNRLTAEYPSFYCGQVDGYFEGEPPKEFWLMLAYYSAVSAITSIVWAKYFAPKELDGIIKLNKSILSRYDEMRILIPDWYEKHRSHAIPQ